MPYLMIIQSSLQDDIVAIHTIPPLNWRATINCPLQDIKTINRWLPKKSNAFLAARQSQKRHSRSFGSFPNSILVITHIFPSGYGIETPTYVFRIPTGFHIIARGCGTPLPRVSDISPSLFSTPTELRRFSHTAFVPRQT